MIEEWRKGCSCALYEPVNCHECTSALIDAIENKLKKDAAIRKLKVEFQIEMLEIKNNYHGLAIAALSFSCATRFAGRVKEIRAYRPIGKCGSSGISRVTNITVGGEPITFTDSLDELMKAINDKLSAERFDYPECLNRIVDIAVGRAEKEIDKFKKIDEHDEMTLRMSKPVSYDSSLPYSGAGGQAGKKGSCDLSEGMQRFIAATINMR